MRSTFRWLIRSLCLLALAAVLAAWVTSYWAVLYSGWIEAGRYREGGIVHGYCFMHGRNNFPGGDAPLQAHVQSGSIVEYWVPESTTLGFHAGLWHARPDSFEFVFPLWLPTLLLLGLNAVVWRKAFRRTPRGAFPIEPTTAA